VDPLPRRFGTAFPVVNICYSDNFYEEMEELYLFAKAMLNMDVVSKIFSTGEMFESTGEMFEATGEMVASTGELPISAEKS